MNILHIINESLGKLFNFLSIGPKHIVMIPSYMFVFISTFEKHNKRHLNNKWRCRKEAPIYSIHLKYQNPVITLQDINIIYSNYRYILIKRTRFRSTSRVFKCIKAF